MYIVRERLHGAAIKRPPEKGVPFEGTRPPVGNGRLPTPCDMKPVGRNADLFGRYSVGLFNPTILIILPFGFT